MDGSLRREETLAIHNELVAFGYAAKDAGVVENEAIAVCGRLFVKEQARGESGKSAANNNTVIDFAGFRDVRGRLVVFAIAHGVRVLHHLLGISGRSLVVAFAGVTGPPGILVGRLRIERKRTSSGRQHARGSPQRAVQKIAPRNRLVQTENFIQMRTLTHSKPPHRVPLLRYIQETDSIRSAELPWGQRG